MTYLENLLLCFINLTVSKTYKVLLYQNGLYDALLPLFVLSQKDNEEASGSFETCIVYALKVISNLSYVGCPEGFLKRLITPLSNILLKAKA